MFPAATDINESMSTSTVSKSIKDAGLGFPKLLCCTLSERDSLVTSSVDEEEDS